MALLVVQTVGSMANVLWLRATELFKVEDVVVSFGPTAAPSTEVEGKSVLEICVGDPLVARECGEAVLPPGDFGRSKRKNVRNRSRFLGIS